MTENERVPHALLDELETRASALGDDFGRWASCVLADPAWTWGTLSLAWAWIDRVHAVAPAWRAEVVACHATHVKDRAWRAALLSGPAGSVPLRGAVPPELAAYALASVGHAAGRVVPRTVAAALEALVEDVFLYLDRDQDPGPAVLAAVQAVRLRCSVDPDFGLSPLDILLASVRCARSAHDLTRPR